MLVYEEVADLFEYRPEVGGSCLVWKRKAAKNTIVGSIAGRRHKVGYWEVRVNRHLTKAHRLVWLLHNKSWPSKNIDHIDGNPENNRIENLRQCTQSQNNQNQKKQRHYRKLPIGVSIKGNKFRARIMLDRREHWLGVFSTPEEAHAAYIAAKAHLHIFNPVLRCV